MRVGVYVKGSIESIYREIDTSKILKGKNIDEALKRLRINESNFIQGFVEVTDKETEITLKFPQNDFKNFIKTLWYVRQKLLKSTQKG